MWLYPTEFPTDDITKLVVILKNGWQKEDIPRCLKTANAVYCWACGVYVGDPDQQLLALSADAEQRAKEQIMELLDASPKKVLIAEMGNMEMREGDAEASPLGCVPLDYFVRQLLEVLLSYIQKWLDELSR